MPRTQQRASLILVASAWLLAANGPAVCVSSSNDPPVDASASDATGGGGAGQMGSSFDGGPASGADGGQQIDAKPQALTGYLWYVGVAVNAFTKSQTMSSSESGPSVTVAPNWPVGTFQDLVFDQMGNLWTIPTTGDQVLRFPGAQLMNNATPFPELVVSSTALNSPQSLALDTAGNLWVVNFAGAGISIANIVRFDGLVGKTGKLDLTPSLTISPGGDDASKALFSEGTALAFSPSGKLWFGGANDVLGLGDVSGMSGQVTATPKAVLSTGESYSSLGFSPGGALWVTATKAGYFALRFDQPDKLGGNVTKESARLTLPAPDAMFVGGLGFDTAGNVWAATSKKLFQFLSADSIMGTVTQSPAVELGVGIGVPSLGSKLVLR